MSLQQKAFSTQFFLHFFACDVALQLWSNFIDDPLLELAITVFIILAEFEVKNLMARVCTDNLCFGLLR